MLSATEQLRREGVIRRRLKIVSMTLWVTGVLTLVAWATWVTHDVSLVNAALLQLLLGVACWGYGSIRYHGRSIDEAYRLGYDLGYEIGWHAREFEDNNDNGDKRPLAPRRTK